MKKFAPQVLRTLFLSCLLLLTVQVAPVSAAIPTDPNFKVAFTGDTGWWQNFEQVLTLVKSENAQLILHQGDFAYGDDNAWKDTVNRVLGTNFPYLGSDGNHDTWGTYATFFEDRLIKMGLPIDTVLTAGGNYTATYKGLKMVFVKENGDPNYIRSQLQGDDHIWKICSWHKNQTYMQVGGKGNEQGWPDYETCREFGAVIMTAHEHSYHRTKTLTDMDTLTVDTQQHPLINGVPSNPNQVVVAPGKSFVVVSGLGGNSIRNQNRCLPSTYPYGTGTGCNYIWANIYTSDQNATYGALFITFNVGGNPNKATGYFKNINGQIIDQFEITSNPIPQPSTSPTASVLPSPTPVTSPQPSTSPTIPVPGDANNDGQVTLADFAIFISNFGSSNSGTINGDFNNDGKVQAMDFAIWLNEFLP